MAKKPRNKLEDWLRTAPSCVKIKKVHIERQIEEIKVKGKKTPMLVLKKYEGTINIEMDKYE